MPTPPLRFAPFLLDAANALLLREGIRVELEPRALELLRLLASRPGQLVTKEEILDSVWGRRFVSESVVKTVVSNLRAAIDDDARAPRWIETVNRRGYRFIGQIDADATTAPEAASAGALPVVPLQGRARALGVLGEALAAARGGRRQILFVAGEAGIGKSTLVEHFIATGLPGGMALAVGQCVELYGSSEAYMPVLEALGMLCRGAGGADTVALMRQVAPTWLAQLPWLHADSDRAAFRIEGSGATPERMLREFGELVDRKTVQQPLVLVLEDLHWSDHATVQLLDYLARRRASAALLLIGTFRPVDVILAEHPLAGMRQELRLHRLCQEIALESLSEAEVGALVSERLDGAEVPVDFVRALYAHTDGVPLHVAHVLDELLASGSLRRTEACPGTRGDWAFPAPDALGVPDTIAGVIDKHAARLPQEQLRLLEAASVAGVEFLHLAVAAALGLNGDAARDALDRLAARQHWLRATSVIPMTDGRLGARYAFRHALVRRAFYQRVGAGQRMQWHRLIAASLMATYGTSAEEVAAELAMHFEQGGEPLEAVRQLAVAAARAVARGAAQDALRGARHGLQLLDGLAPAAVARVECEELELELRVLEGVALTRLHVISTAPVAAAFDCAGALADRAGPSTARARALFGRWRVSFARAEVAQARRLAMHMLERAGGDDPALAAAARCALGCTLAMMGDLLPARRELQDVLASGEADRATGIFVHDPGVVARGYLALVLWWAGDPVPARRLAAEAVARADELRHPLSQLIALNLAAGLHFDAGEYERVLTCVDDLHEVIRRHGLPQVPGSFSWLRGHALTRLGRPEDGLGEMRDGLRCLEQGMRTGLSGYYLHYAEALRDVGRPDDAAAAVDEGLRFGDDTGERVLLPALLCLKAELTSTRGQADVANAALDRASELARRQGAAFHEIGVHVLSARLRGRRGQDESAATGRLRHLLQLFEGEQAPMLVAARMLLGA